LRPAQAKSYPDLISTRKLGMVVCACNLSNAGDVGVRGSWFQASPREKLEGTPVLPKNKGEKSFAFIT
jgi:hypothetical protein